MRIRGYGRVKRWLQRVTAVRRPMVAILMYHRVYDAASDPWGLCVGRAHFNEHMEHLRRHYSVLSLRELRVLLAAGRLPERAVVLTFDDGYADNLWNAKPILARWDLPATVFVSTGYVGQSREFWWDELDRLLLQSGTLPGTLDVRLDGRVYEWKLGESAVYTDQDRRRHSAWRAEGTEDPTPRHSLYRSLYGLLHPLPEVQQRQILDYMSTWSGASAEGRPGYRALSPEELISLEEGRLVEVGAHTVTHPVLSSLSIAAQRDEITQGKVRLEEVLGHTVSNFSYPHGAYTAETIALVRSAAFTSGCSSLRGVVGPDTDPYRLPRFQIRDWDGKEFSRRLRMFANRR